MAAARKSVFRTIAEAVNASLVTILTAEERMFPSEDAFVFGNTAFKTDTSLPRIQWGSVHGTYVTDPIEGATTTPPVPAPDPPVPPVTPLYVLRKQALIWIWASSEEEAEHLALRMPLATERSGYQKYFHWALAHEEDPYGRVGEQLQNGVHVVRIQVPVDIQVAGEADGEYELREVTDAKLQAGIVESRADDLDPTDRAVAEWDG